MTLLATADNFFY